MPRKIVCLILLLLSFSSFAQARYDSERVTNFVSDIIVNRDASLDIAENISVYATGQQIQTGISRYLPIHYLGRDGIIYHYVYTINKVQLNGEPVAYQFSVRDKKFVISMGEKDVFLTPGIYDYFISYHVENAVNRLMGSDELYWNVTGNEWTLPIIKAQANIQLPDGVRFSSYFAYTGRKGESQQNFNVQKPLKNEIIFTTQQPLSPGESLTATAAWPQSAVDRSAWVIHLSKNQFFLLVIATIVFVYFSLILAFNARDPRKGEIKPLFKPPGNLSPAEMRYIFQMGFDTKVFTAAIVSMAIKGFLKILYSNSDFLLQKIKAYDEKLHAEERVTSEALFQRSQKVMLKSSNYDEVVHAKKNLITYLKTHYKDRYFITNTNYFVPGVLISLLGFIGAIILADEPSNTGLALIWLSVWTTICSLLLAKLYSSFYLAYVDTSIINIFSAVFFAAFSLPFLIGEVLGIYVFSAYIPIFTVPLLFFLVALDVIFYYLLKAPTIEGRKVMDQIEGFKIYLRTTDLEKLKEFKSPQMTMELYEKYLPYAVALNVEKEWGQRFWDELIKSKQAPGGYAPDWYVGGNWTTANLANMLVILSSGLTSALASATSVANSGTLPTDEK